MTETNIDEIIETIFSDKQASRKLKNMNLSPKELKDYIEEIKQKPERAYNRILAEGEKRVLTTEAFGYLMHMLIIGSIDKNIFEKVISACMQVFMVLEERIDKLIIDEIIDYFVFSGEDELNMKDLIGIFFREDNTINEEIN